MRKSFAMQMAASLVWLAWTAPPINAQNSISKSLAQMPKISYLSKDPDADDLRCGISKDATQSAFMFPISDSRLTLSPGGAKAPVFFVDYATLVLFKGASNELCVSNLNVQVLSSEMVTLQSNDLTIESLVVLFGNSQMLSSPRGLHGERFRQAIERQTKKFLVEWNFANPRR